MLTRLGNTRPIWLVLGGCAVVLIVGSGLAGMFPSNTRESTVPQRVLVASSNTTTVKTRYSNNGCVCLSNCGYSFDVTFAWCYTSDVFAPNEGTHCGQFSTLRQAWWDYCKTDTTLRSATGADLLSNFLDVWGIITATTVLGCAVAYLLAGIMAAYLLPMGHRTKACLPICGLIAGGIFGFVVSAASSAAIALMYLSVPYFVNVNVAVALGIAQAAALVYAHLGRGYASVHQRVLS